MDKLVCYILGLFGGKDSMVLVIYMCDCVLEMEYFFCDMGVELLEIYEYLVKFEVYFGKKIVWLLFDCIFDYWLKVYCGILFLF